MEYFTVSASILSPLENFRPERRVHRYAMLEESVKRHSRAASGSGLVLPVGKLTRVWKTFLMSSQEPSQAAAGSRVEGELVVPTDIRCSVSEPLSDNRPQPASREREARAAEACRLDR